MIARTGKTTLSIEATRNEKDELLVKLTIEQGDAKITIEHFYLLYFSIKRKM